MADDGDRRGAETARRTLRHRWLVGLSAGVLLLGTGIYVLVGLGPSRIPAAQAERACEELVGKRAEAFTAVGVGHSVDLFAMKLPSGWKSCFDGMGVGEGPVTASQMSAPLSLDAEVVDGTLTTDVLVLVHLSGSTKTAVVDTRRSRSIRLASGHGFEVLEVPTTGWPHGRAFRSGHQVSVGLVTGYDRAGHAETSIPLTWCPGAINPLPGQC